MLKNYMEVVIEQALATLLQEDDYDEICKCEQCIDDIKAIALNELKPTYIASSSGMLYSKIQEIRVQNVVDSTAALVKAIEIVTKHPRH